MTGVAYVCAVCARSYPITTPIWCCSCGGHLNLPLGPGLDRGAVDRDEPSLWRYRRALPVAPSTPAAYFGEGRTPLVEREWGGRLVAFKLDYLFPTGSFKDRGSAVLINHLHALGIRAVHEDSSGNGGASIAAYCAAAGIRCTIYVPAGTSEGKLVQIRAYGARLVKVPGPREAAAAAAVEAAREAGSQAGTEVAAERATETTTETAARTFYASHNWHPLFIEGVKTLAYELWEQLGWSAPDVVMAPIGYGSTILGLYRGFRELLTAGSISRLPRIYACQAANCAPFHRAFQAADPAAGQLAPDEVRPTMAEGVAATRPLRVREVLDALHETRGATVAVTEEEIAAAVRDLAARGLYVEPTSAVAPAAAHRLLAAGTISAGERVVVILTGSGLKATDRIGSLWGAEVRPEA